MTIFHWLLKDLQASIVIAFKKHSNTAGGQQGHSNQEAAS